MKVKLKRVRLSFPDLYEARQFQGEGEFRYGAVGLLDKSTKQGKANIKAVEDAILAEAKIKFKDKAEKKLAALRGNSNKFCFTDGDNIDRDGYEGHMALAARRKQSAGPPLVLDVNKTPLSEKSGKPYAGCYVNMNVDIWVQTGQFEGVRATLLGVQFVEDGDSFAAGAAVSDDDFDDESDLSTEDEDNDDLA